MLTRLRIPIPLGQAKVNHINDVLLLSVTDQEIIGLHVTMNKVIVVKEF